MIRTLAPILALVVGCGVEPPCAPAALAPLDTAPSWAVVTSDYQSSAVALLDADGSPITEAWIDSGTTEPGIVASLTGDVVLPTEPWPGELVLLDRYGVDVITRVALPDGRVLGQVPTQLARGDTGYRANPHDAVRLDGSRALVSRYEPNPSAAAPPLDRGNDLVVVDLETATLVDRFPFEPFDVVEAGSRYHARPDRMVRVGDRVVVGLGRMTGDTWQAADGAVVVLDPATGDGAAVALEGLRNCGTVARDPEEPDVVLVLCAGDGFEPDTGVLVAASDATRRRHAGIVSLRVAADGTAAVEHRWHAADEPDRPVPTSSLVALGGGRLVFTAMGDDRSGRPDRTYLLDPSRGEETLLVESEAFAIGPGRYAPEQRLLLLPDATVGVRRLRIGEDGSAEELSPADCSPCRALPAREIAPLAPGT